MKYCKWALYPGVILLLSGCFSAKYLKDDEYLFSKQKINGNIKVSKDELTVLYQAKPNKRFPLIPGLYVWFYETGKKSFDIAKYEDKITKINAKYDKKIKEVKENAKKEERINKHRSKKITKQEKSILEGNLLMRWGEPIEVLDSQSVVRTTDQLELYLHSKGYFRGGATYSIKYRKRKAKVIYSIVENNAYIFDTVFTSISDPLIRSIINSDDENSLLVEGDNYDQEKLISERVRVETLLKNNGFFDFSRQYIDYDVDTTLGDNSVGIRMIIKNPGASRRHRIFTIDSVNFTTDANVRIPNQDRVYESYNGVTYQSYNNQYSYKILDRRSFIYPGNIYSLENTLETQKQLVNLNIFRFVNVNYDSSGGKFVANIFASPLRRQQFTTEVGLTVTYGYPGPFFSLGYLVRNIFHGLENLQINTRIGLEGVPSATDFTNILADIEAGLDASLIFPQYLIPWSNGMKNRSGEYNPKTILKGGYSYSDRPEYIRKRVSTSVAYTWSNKKRRRYSFIPFEMNLINTVFQDSAFVKRLLELEQEGNNLINSFKPSFVSSTSFNAFYYFGGAEIRKDVGSILRLGLESGGTFLNLFGTDFLTERELEYYKYFRTNIDLRKRSKLSSVTTIAYHINIGAAFPYSKDKLLPYEDYFFAGGAVSNRAWRPRRLGPGSFTPTDSEGNVSYNVEQPGEILLESGIELREKISKVLELAIFADFGNIWTTRKSDNRYSLGGDLNQFVQEIAVGSGFGLRLDFSYFLFRLDAAFKIYDPARQPGSRFFLNSGFNTDPVAEAHNNESPLLNFAIGYPF